MTTYRVDADSVVALGGSLADLADSLAVLGDPQADRGAMGTGEVGPAFEDLVGGWRHVRLAVARDLAGLAEAAATAGGLYLDTEAGASRSLRGGLR